MNPQLRNSGICLSKPVIILVALVAVSSAYVCYFDDLNVSGRNPLLDKDDYFRVWYRFLAPDGIQVKMSAKTAEALHKFYMEHSYYQNQEYLMHLFRKMRQWDETGYGDGGIKDDDHKYASKVVHEGFGHLKDKIMDLKNKTCDAAIYLRTQRRKDWIEGEAANAISFKNDFNDDELCCS